MKEKNLCCPQAPDQQYYGEEVLEDGREFVYGLPILC